jgi:ABC-type transporter Mla MlaB component
VRAPDRRQSPPGEPDRGPPSGATTWVLGTAVGRADVPVLRERLVAILRESRASVVVCDVGAITEPDAGTVDALARLQLTAQRLGCGIRLRRAHRRLRDLLAFTGLGEVLPVCAEPAVGSVVEPGRQAECGEQPIDVEERVDPPDPAA